VLLLLFINYQYLYQINICFESVVVIIKSKAMAINAAKQLLDELMGRERDLAPNDKKTGMDWNDSRVRL